jgi:hypothetical protein
MDDTASSTWVHSIARLMEHDDALTADDTTAARRKMTPPCRARRRSITRIMVA